MGGGAGNRIAPYFMSPLPPHPSPCVSFVPENVLKKRKARDELAAKAAALRKDEKAAAKVRRQGMFKRAEVRARERCGRRVRVFFSRRVAARMRLSARRHRASLALLSLRCAGLRAGVRQGGEGPGREQARGARRGRLFCARRGQAGARHPHSRHQRRVAQGEEDSADPAAAPGACERGAPAAAAAAIEQRRARTRARTGRHAHLPPRMPLAPRRSSTGRLCASTRRRCRC